jgi:hypothetical protein
MARKKVPRTLSVLPVRDRLVRREHSTESLVEILRTVAVKNQCDQPRAFYSMREVSAHFDVPFSTVARAYHRLDQEGFLTRVRGSKTMLQGLRFDRRKGVRAFIGLPASLSAFVTIQAYRMFFIRIRRELRLRGFATGMVFFENPEARNSMLGERLEAYEVDAVLWFQPPKEATGTAPRLRDLGIPVLGVAHEQVPGIPCRYEVRRDRAIAALLTNWKSQNGIHHVTVAQWQEYRASSLEDALYSALEDVGLKTSIANFQGQRCESFLRSLYKAKTDAIIFSSAQLTSKLCLRVPRAVVDLLRKRRAALLNGPVSSPFAKLPDVRVDLVVVDWQSVAEQIVSDFITQRAFHSPGPTIFEAEAKLRVPLSAFAQAI